MTVIVLFWLNVLLLSLFASLALQPRLLGFAKGGKWYLTWFAVGLITLMDELTSIFYAPAEAHRFIGTQAIFFIAATSLLMRVLSTRMVEIAQILELHNMRGGGVHHGVLHPDRLHLDGQRGHQRNRVPAPRSRRAAGRHPRDHLGDRRPQ